MTIYTRVESIYEENHYIKYLFNFPDCTWDLMDYHTEEGTSVGGKGEP